MVLYETDQCPVTNSLEKRGCAGQSKDLVKNDLCESLFMTLQRSLLTPQSRNKSSWMAKMEDQNIFCVGEEQETKLLELTGVNWWTGWK